ncbi:portal protein [Caulobacter sp. FWC2]|uniref:portal protein n=1 Tax=Caulobacter sp. FWC2 TaxID=69664 RepID=UPI000C14B110|nr:portal protein [Caulobacter sp. FWC2]PIB91284.1 hypothetical protein CSW62_06665 [Caulobacter sp. FWC2]
MAEDANAYTIPDGFEDEDAFCQWVREEFQADLDADRLNRDATLEDMEFHVGKHWTDADLAARKGKPCLTINDLPQKVAQVTGDIRINRPAIKISPAEENDKAEADIREGLVRQIERECDAQGIYVGAGETQAIGGVGAFEVDIDFADPRSFNRVIRLKSIPNPLSVVWDRMSVEKTGRDAGHVWVSDVMTRKAFDKAYPDKVPSDLTSDMAQADWCTTDTVRVTRLCMMKETKVEIALLEDGSVVDADKVPEGATVLRKRETVRKSCCIYLTNGHSILAEPVEWPIDRVPVIKVTANELWVGDRRVRWGLVRFAKDPARLKNYWRSVSAESLALAPKAQWLMPQTAASPNDDFRDAAENGDTVLPYDANNRPERVNPPPISAAVLNEAAMASQDMKDVTGIHDASLGIRSNETSGKAILARQREGDVATYVYGDNLRASIRAGGDVINQLLPITYDTKRIITILGKDEVAKAVNLNDPNDPQSIKFGDSKYDVVIDTGPSYTTQRVEAAETLTSLAQSMPILGQVAPDLIIKSHDIPLGNEIAERLHKSLPPQLTADPNQPQQPPPPNPAQEQAQNMALQKAQLDLREQNAKARKAEADADKAEADAAVAIAQASMTGVNPHEHAPLSAPLEMPGAPPQDQFAPAPPMSAPMSSLATQPAPTFEQGPASPEQLAPGQGFQAA